MYIRYICMYTNTCIYTLYSYLFICMRVCQYLSVQICILQLGSKIYWNSKQVCTYKVNVNACICRCIRKCICMCTCL